MAMQFANGAVENKLVCLGLAKIDGLEQAGLIVIENESKQILLGMDFLKKFGLKLLVCPTTAQIEIVPAAAAFSIPAARPVPPPAAAGLPPAPDVPPNAAPV